MPFFPEQLYQLAPRDLQVTWLDPLIRRVEHVAAIANTLARFTVPSDRVLLLTSGLAQSDPGAGQQITSQELTVASPADEIHVLLQSNPQAIAVDLNAHIAFSGAVVVPPRWNVQAAASFNAAVAVNSTTLMITGMLIPAANFQHV